MDIERVFSEVEKEIDDVNNICSLYDAVDIMEECDDPSIFIEPILDFMGKHPISDFGNPGPFVHFVEQYGLGKYSRQDYENLICEFFKKSPSIAKLGMIMRCCGRDNPNTESLLKCIREVKDTQNLQEELAECIEEALS